MLMARANEFNWINEIPQHEVFELFMPLILPEFMISIRISME